jgi:hypothetical protein
MCILSDFQHKPAGDFFEMNLPYCILAEAVKKEMEAVGSHIQVHYR